MSAADPRERTQPGSTAGPLRRRFELTAPMSGPTAEAKFLFYDRETGNLVASEQTFVVADPLDLIPDAPIGTRGWCVRMADAHRWEVTGPRYC